MSNWPEGCAGPMARHLPNTVIRDDDHTLTGDEKHGFNPGSIRRDK